MTGAASILALKTALRTALLADAPTTALVGQSIHDAPPRGLEAPFVVLGDAVSRDNGTNDGAGEIVDLDLVIVTKERGTHAALGIAAAVETALAELPPVLAGISAPLVMCRETLTRHDEARSLTRAVLRLRAFLHPV